MKKTIQNEQNLYLLAQELEENKGLKEEMEIWKPLIDSLNKFSDDFMESRNQPKKHQKKDIFS